MTLSISLHIFIYVNNCYFRQHAVCSNKAGSFSCACESGYKNFVPNEGCTDIDECISSKYFYSIYNNKLQRMIKNFDRISTQKRSSLFRGSTSDMRSI